MGSSKDHRKTSKKSRKHASQKDNGMMTKVWGPAGWVFLHSIVMGYPTTIDSKNKEHRKRKKETKRFFETLGFVLPCKYCRESYNKFIKEMPITPHLNSRKSISMWLYKIHNKVNNKLGVPKCDVPTFQQVTKRYETYRAKCHRTTKKERDERLEKGCVVPKDGISKRCVIQVINAS